MTDYHLFHVAVKAGTHATADPRQVELTIEAVLRGYGYDIVPCNWTPDHDTVWDAGLRADRDDTLAIHDLNPAFDNNYEPEWTIGRVATLLQLVNEPMPAGYSEWDRSVMEDVGKWAAAVHLHASDNPDVVIPPKPKVLT